MTYIFVILAWPEKAFVAINIYLYADEEKATEDSGHLLKIS
jgi:hypothetical protein